MIKFQIIVFIILYGTGLTYPNCSFPVLDLFFWPNHSWENCLSEQEKKKKTVTVIKIGRNRKRFLECECSLSKTFYLERNLNYHFEKTFFPLHAIYITKEYGQGPVLQNFLRL